MKDFSGKEKLFFYQIIRLLAIADPNHQLGFLLVDLENLYKRRGYFNEEYFYYTSLSDNQFCYEIDCKLTNSKARRYLYRMRGSKFGRKQLSLQEVLSNYFFTDIITLNRQKAKKAIRHKGYRDHGSLGSEYSKTLKQQSVDWSLREIEQRRIKDKQDLLDFITGFCGWI
jgi:hypothetical protein